MTRPSLAALKAAYKPTQRENGEGSTFTNNYYPFWNMKPGERCVIRFIPDKNENNPRGFLVEKVFHNLTINGQKKTVPCLSMYEQDCPICKLSQDYYKVDDKVNGGKYWRKKQYIAQALIVEDPLPAGDDGETHEGKIRYFALGYQIYKIIQEAFGSDDLDEVPYSFEGGYDFVIKKTEQGGYASYNVGTKFQSKQRDLTEEELSITEEHMIDLSTLLPKNPGVEKVQAMLNADINGGDVDEDDDAPTPPVATKSVSKKPVVVDEDDEDVPAPRVNSLPPKSTKQAAQAEESASSDEDVEAMLATIRARRAKQEPTK